MANYVLTFRAPKGSAPTGEDEARWPAWLAGIGGQITDPGNRIGQARSVGGTPDRRDVLAGYIVISAGSLDAAVAMAEGCPMLLQGGNVEVGEVIPAGPAS
jgi:YCII-related domain